jgi:hypothetical protein
MLRIDPGRLTDHWANLPDDQPALPSDDLPHVHVNSSAWRRFLEDLSGEVQNRGLTEEVELVETLLNTNDIVRAVAAYRRTVGPAGPPYGAIINLIRYGYMQILFNYIVRRLGELVLALQNAYTNNPTISAYNQARDNYLAFVRGLDCRQPGVPSLGNPVKWVDIVPYVPDDDTCQPIIGLRVVVKWNPHSSSSGIHVP